MKCPRCQTDMLLAIRSEVEIDHCPQCEGIWLDRGELEKLIERSDKVISRKAASAPEIFWEIMDHP